MKKILLFTIMLLLLPSILALDEVPFEVFKTEMTESVTVSDNSVLFYDTQNNRWASSSGDGMTGKQGGDMDTLLAGTFVNLDSVTYSLKFQNVGKLGGEDYAQAELQIDYNVGSAHKIVLKSGEEILKENGEYYANLLKNDNSDEIIKHIEKQVSDGVLDGEKGRKKVTIESPDLPSKKVKLSFSGGPFGKFGTKVTDVKDGVVVMGEVTNEATDIILRPGGGSEENYFKHGLYHLQPSGVNRLTIPIKGDGLEKWMAIIKDAMGECSDPENPNKDSGIRFSDIWGEALYVPCNGVMDELWEMAELDVVLHVEDRVKTGSGDSGVILSLSDMTTFKMRPDTEVVLSNPPEKESKIALISGKVWANLKSMVKDGSMKVEMSEAVCGIKGTTWIMEDDGKNSVLKVIDGEVEFTSKKNGKSVMVGPGEAIRATSKGLSEKTSFDVQAEAKNWENDNFVDGNYIDTAKFKDGGFPFGLVLLLVILVAAVFVFRGKIVHFVQITKSNHSKQRKTKK